MHKSGRQLCASALPIADQYLRHVLQQRALVYILRRRNRVLRGQEIVPTSNPCKQFRPNGINGDF